MVIQTRYSFFKEHPVISALIASIIVHFLFFVLIPRWENYSPEKKVELVVELQKKVEIPKPPAPLSPKPLPEQPKPKKTLDPKPQIKPPTPAVFAQSEIKAPPPTTAPVIIETPREVLAISPKTNSIPTPVVKAAPVEIVKSNEPSAEDIDAAKNRYSSMLGRAIAKHKEYPRIAQTRGWQGECSLEVELDGNGNLKVGQMIQSCGYEVLDKKALEMLRKALPLAPPEALRGRSFKVTVPVSFKLE